VPEDRLAAAIAAIDEVNAADPELIDVGGGPRPKELVHSELMTEFVTALDPGAGEAQLLAARAHHLRRWSLPRSNFPSGRAGYLQWRSTLRRQHAEETGAILSGVGYEESIIERVQAIILKHGLGAQPPDPQVQVHEDALCLVFLVTQLDALAARLGDERTESIVLKSLAKMSQAGQEAALDIDLSHRGRRLLDHARAAI